MEVSGIYYDNICESGFVVKTDYYFSVSEKKVSLFILFFDLLQQVHGKFQIFIHPHKYLHNYGIPVICCFFHTSHHSATSRNAQI